MRAMKDSGVEWIGEIPAEWKTERLQWHLEEINIPNSPVQSENILSLTIEAGVIPYEEKGNQGNKAKENCEEYKLAYPDTLVVNSMNVIIGAVGISKYFGCVSPVYYVFKAAKGSNLRYIYYLFTNVGFQKEMRKYAKGIMEIRLRIAAADMLKLSIPLPSAAEQQRIAAYLDEQCGEIDKVLAKTRESIEEYKKLKQSVITEAVTKGIRPNRPMKPSGIEWIGDIPAEWGMRRLRHLGCCQNGISKGAEFFDSGYPFVSYSDVYKNMELPHKVNGLVESTDEERERYSVLRGDIFFTRTSETIEEIGFTAVCLKTIPNATFAGFLIRVRPTTPLITPEFSKYYFRNDSHRCFFVKEMNLVTRASLGQELLKSLPVLLPPLDEQQEIAAYLDRQCAEIDRLIAKKEQIITELEGYKKSLIYECVTGKREVAEKRNLVDIFGKTAKMAARAKGFSNPQLQKICDNTTVLAGIKTNFAGLDSIIRVVEETARTQRILGDISRMTTISQLPPLPKVPDGIMQSTHELSKIIEVQRKMFDLPPLPKVSDSIMQSTRRLTQMIEDQRKMLQPFQANFNSIAQMLRSTAAAIGPLASLSTIHRQIAKDWDAIWKNIRIPVKPEIRQKKRAAYKRWAEFGWSCHPNIEFSEIPPESSEIADQFVMQELENYGVDNFIEELSQMVVPNQNEDFESAVFNFKHGYFRTCARVIFSLIDREFIIRQPKEVRPNGKPKQRELAKGAAEIFRKTLDEPETAEKILNRVPRFFYRCENMFYAVITIFESANDFRDEDKTVGLNRNFVDHGMSQRQATKKHCLQLFLLYYNVLGLFSFFDHIWPIKDERWLPTEKNDAESGGDEKDSE